MIFPAQAACLAENNLALLQLFFPFTEALRSSTSATSICLGACRTWDDSAATVEERTIFHRFLLTYCQYARRKCQNLYSLSQGLYSINVSLSNA